MVLAVIVTLLALPAPAEADSHLSPGCLAVDREGSALAWSWSLPLLAGEHVSIHVGEPATGDITGITLTITPEGEPAEAVDSDGFPGTVGYTVPTDGRYIYAVRTVSPSDDRDRRATFTWSCTAGPPEPMFPETGKDFGAYVSEIAKSGGMGSDGYKPGSHRGFAKAIHGDDVGNGKKLGPK